jgi:hypothetical protein
VHGHLTLGLQSRIKIVSNNGNRVVVSMLLTRLRLGYGLLFGLLAIVSVILGLGLELR